MRKIKEALQFHKQGISLLKVAHEMVPLIIPVGLLMTVFGVAVNFAEIILSAHLIDALVAGAFKQAGEWALYLIAVSLTVGILMQLLLRKYQLLTMECSGRFTMKLREKALSLDYETMENPGVVDKILFLERTESMYGGMGQLANHYIKAIGGALTMGTSVTMVAALCFKKSSAIGILGTFAHPLVSLFLFIMIFSLTSILTGAVAKKYLKKNEEIFSNHTSMENRLFYLLNGVFLNHKVAKVIRIFHMEDMLFENGKKEMKTEDAFFKKWGDVEDGQAVSAAAVNSIFSISTYLLTAVKFLAGAITVGGFTQYVGAMNRFGAGFKNYSDSMAKVKKICSYMKQFMEFMAMEGEHEKGSIPVEKRLDGEYELAFEDVSFHYPGSEDMILKHVNCRLNMKDKMAVVGRNGAGKTTFIKLLCRLYEPTEGRITLNGVDIRKYNIEEYRDLLGVVFQDFNLFAFPVKDNIAAGYEYDEEKMKKCIRQAGAEEAIGKMPKGADTLLYKELGDGVELSGGEAQKIALARALYKDAPLVILDEPTAALDPLGEAQVYAGFDEMVKDKTSIYISHRMSSCRFCNDIIVFDEGKIVERGSHEALLEKEGQYYKLWNAQAQYYAG